MKKALILAIGFLLVLAGCALQGSGTGHISLSLPSALTRAADSGSVTVAQVSLYRFGVALPIDGEKTVIEQEVASGDTIEIIDLQAGPGYRIAIALGSYDNGFFKPAQYGTSEKFSVVSDAAAVVDLALAKSPFTWITTAAGSVAVVGSEVWLYSANALRRLDADTPEVSLGGKLEGRTVNSITAGLAFANDRIAADNILVPRLWLNTTNGIVPFADGTPQLSFMKSGLADVTYSVALKIKPSADAKTKLVAFFSGYMVDRSATNMGGVGTDDPAVWDWQDLAGNLGNVGEFGAVLSEADVLKGVAIGDQFYYIATSLNTFRIDNALTASFTEGTDVTTFITTKILNGTDTIISVPGETIVQVATAGGYIYAGTKHGLYAASIDALGKPIGNFTLIGGGQATDRVTGLAAVVYKDVAYAAAVTADGTLVLAKNGALLKSYDAMAGVPAQAVPTFWTGGTGLNLYLAGSGSTVRMTVPGL
jgi:hypothetical protein